MPSSAFLAIPTGLLEAGDKLEPLRPTVWEWNPADMLCALGWMTCSWAPGFLEDDPPDVWRQKQVTSVATIAIIIMNSALALSPHWSGVGFALPVVWWSLSCVYWLFFALCVAWFLIKKSHVACSYLILFSGLYFGVWMVVGNTLALWPTHVAIFLFASLPPAVHVLAGGRLSMAWVVTGLTLLLTAGCVVFSSFQRQRGLPYPPVSLEKLVPVVFSCALTAFAQLCAWLTMHHFAWQNRMLSAAIRQNAELSKASLEIIMRMDMPAVDALISRFSLIPKGQHTETHEHLVQILQRMKEYNPFLPDTLFNSQPDAPGEELAELAKVVTCSNRVIRRASLFSERNTVVPLSRETTTTPRALTVCAPPPPQSPLSNQKPPSSTGTPQSAPTPLSDLHRSPPHGPGLALEHSPGPAPRRRRRSECTLPPAVGGLDGSSAGRSRSNSLYTSPNFLSPRSAAASSPRSSMGWPEQQRASLLVPVPDPDALMARRLTTAPGVFDSLLTTTLALWQPHDRSSASGRSTTASRSESGEAGSAASHSRSGRSQTATRTVSRTGSRKSSVVSGSGSVYNAILKQVFGREASATGGDSQCRDDLAASLDRMPMSESDLCPMSPPLSRQTTTVPSEAPQGNPLSPASPIRKGGVMSPHTPALVALPWAAALVSPRGAGPLSHARPGAVTIHSPRHQNIHLEYGLTKKTITMVVVNVPEVNACLQREGAEVYAQLTQATEAMTAVVKQFQGTVVRSAGGTVFAVWNAVTPNGCHALYACQCALAIKATLALVATGQFATARVAICTDEVLVGNVGREYGAQYNVLGTAVNMCFLMAKLNDQLQTTVIMTAKTHAEVKTHVVARGVDLVQFGKSPGFSPTPVMEIFELCREQENNEEEWMYQLAAQHRMENNFDKAWKLTKQGNHIAASALYKSWHEKNPEDLCAARLLSLARKWSLQVSEEPYKRVVGSPWANLEEMPLVQPVADLPGQSLCIPTLTQEAPSPTKHQPASG